MMHRIVLLAVAIGGVVCATDPEPEYQAKSLDYWIARTQPKYDTTARLEAIRTLRQIGMMRTRRAAPSDIPVAQKWAAENIVPTLGDLLKDQDASVRIEAEIAIGWIDRAASTKIIPSLTEMLFDQNEKVRLNAAGALAFRGQQAEASIPVLIKVVRNDKSLRVRQSAALALRTGGPKGVESLLEMLDDANAEVRRTTVGVFQGQYPNADPRETPLAAVPKLLTLLQNDKDAEARLGEVAALFSIKPLPSEAIPVVARLLRDKDANVRRGVVDHLTGRKEAEQFIPGLIALQDDENGGVRFDATLTLARMGKSEAVAPLVKLLADKRPNTRAYAADILGDMGPAARDAVPALKQHLTDMGVVFDLQGHVCNHAGKAMEKITGDKSFLDGLPPMPVDGK